MSTIEEHGGRLERYRERYREIDRESTLPVPCDANSFPCVLLRVLMKWEIFNPEPLLYCVVLVILD